MDYDPRNVGCRRRLATLILHTLEKADFMEEVTGPGTGEKVFFRPVDDVDGVVVKVYTSIIDGPGGTPEVRETGKDAIRVVTAYWSNKLKQERGLGKETRIHRVGDTGAITERLLDRMREAYRRGRRPSPCPFCGAPTFKSKKGNDVCADICWEKGGSGMVRSGY